MKHRRYPEEIFLQIDGGAENANKYLLGCLEFLVARGIVKSIYYTRLPVGHTHEDIDACFGLLWNWFKKKTVFHPEQYKSELEEAMADSKIPTTVIDIFAVPDYKLFFQPYLDKSLSHLYREDETKLQWHFRAVMPSAKFPLGVKTMYRSYASDQVVMLKQVTKSQASTDIGRLTGLEPYTVLVRWEPASDDLVYPDSNLGMTLLTGGMPILTTQLLPYADFSLDGIASIYSTVTSCKLQWGIENGPEIYNSWINWQTLHYPLLNETAVEYAIRRRLSSPLPMLFKSQHVILQDFSRYYDYVYTEGSYTFEFPTNIAYANASVMSSSNLHPPAPLTFVNLSDNGIHEEPISRFIQNTRVCYEQIIGVISVQRLDQILHRKMKSNGDSMQSLGRSKRDKVEILIIWDQEVIRNRFQILSSSSLAFIANMLSETDNHGNAIFNTNVCVVNGHDLFRSDFKCFLPGNCVGQNMFVAFINLLQQRDDRLCKVRDDLNSTKSKPLPTRKKSLYLSPVNSIENLTNVIHQIDIVHCRIFHRLYIPIYSQDTALVVIDIDAHSIFYYNPYLKYDCPIPIEFSHIKNELQTVFYPLCEQLNGDNNVQRWTISLSPTWINGVLYFPVLDNTKRHDAGIYLMIFLEYLYFDLPLYFNSDDVAYYRKLFCYNIANKCIPNV